jgi:hypothetical protein
MEELVADVLRKVPKDFFQRALFERTVENLVKDICCVTETKYYYLDGKGPVVPKVPMGEVAGMNATYMYDQYLTSLGIDSNKVSLEAVLEQQRILMEHHDVLQTSLTDLMIKDRPTEKLFTDLQKRLLEWILEMEEKILMVTFILDKVLAAPWNVTSIALAASQDDKEITRLFATYKMQKLISDEMVEKIEKMKIDAARYSKHEKESSEENEKLCEDGADWYEFAQAIEDRIEWRLEEVQISLPKQSPPMTTTSRGTVLDPFYRAVSPDQRPVTPTFPQELRDKYVRVIEMDPTKGIIISFQKAT